MDAPIEQTASGGQQPSLAQRVPWMVLYIAYIFTLFLLSQIGTGTLWQNDELLTANRAQEMVVRGDPTAITRNFVPGFKKPPLQYWLCAAALRLVPDHPVARQLAVRLPSLLYGALCLLATAWAARACFPEADPLLALHAALALAGCGYFIHMSRVALLDSGAAFHLTLAVGGCQLARRDPRWHWFVGLQCVLGAWQKAPYAFAAWGVILLARRLQKDPLPPRGRLHLIGALAMSALVASGWWLAQWLRFGGDALSAAGQEQAIALLRPHDDSDAGFHPYLYWFWMARDWAIPGLCAPLAVASVLFRKTGRADPRLVECAAICVLFADALVALPYRAERYLVAITPLLAILSMRWLGEIAGRRRWLVTVALASAAPVALFHYLSPTPARPDLLAASHLLNRSLRPAEEVFLSREADPAFNAGDFVAFYADLNRPLRVWPMARIALWLKENPARPCRGVCKRREWSALQRDFSELLGSPSQGDWIVWHRRNHPITPAAAGQPP